MKTTTVRQGRALEDFVAGRLRVTGLDIRSKRTPGSGNGTHLKSDNDNDLGLAIECKNTKTFTAKYWQQAKKQAINSQLPVLVWHEPGEEFENSTVVIEWHHFESLLLASKAPRTANPDRGMKLAVQGVSAAAGRFLKAWEGQNPPPSSRDVGFRASMLLKALKSLLKEFRGL